MQTSDFAASEPSGQPSVFATIRTVGAPAPNRAGHVFPQHEHDETDVSPFSGSVVPA